MYVIPNMAFHFHLHTSHSTSLSIIPYILNLQKAGVESLSLSHEFVSVSFHRSFSKFLNLVAKEIKQKAD